MRSKPRVYKAHRCPKCSTMTTAKCYCPLCLDTIRQPPRGMRRSPEWPTWREKSELGGRFYAS